MAAIGQKRTLETVMHGIEDGLLLLLVVMPGLAAAAFAFFLLFFGWLRVLAFLIAALVFAAYCGIAYTLHNFKIDLGDVMAMVSVWAGAGLLGIALLYVTAYESRPPRLDGGQQ